MGDIRIKEKWLWIPRKIKGIWYWIEKIRIYERNTSGKWECYKVTIWEDGIYKEI